MYGWQDLRRRRELELLSAYGGSAMQPSTFVPTTQLPLVHSPSTLHSNDAIERPTTSLPRQVSGMVSAWAMFHAGGGCIAGLKTHSLEFRE